MGTWHDLQKRPACSDGRTFTAAAATMAIMDAGGPEPGPRAFHRRFVEDATEVLVQVVLPTYIIQEMVFPPLPCLVIVKRPLGSPVHLAGSVNVVL